MTIVMIVGIALQRQVAFDARADLAVVRTAIANAEVDDRDRDHQREERGDRQHEEIECVHVARKCRRLLGEDRNAE
jgi:hypothetical protein